MPIPEKFLSRYVLIKTHIISVLKKMTLTPFLLSFLPFLILLTTLVWAQEGLEKVNPVREEFSNGVKEPVVSGLFYPADLEVLKNTVDSFLDEAKAGRIDGEIVGLISPHAGYQYSGRVAAFGYKAVKDKDFSTAIIIGPSHHTYFEGISVYNKGYFRTPLGDVAIDAELADSLIAQSDKIYFYPEAFLKEHSVEVQIPFLQRIWKDFKIVPIIMGRRSYEDCQTLAEALEKVIGERKDILVITSTDMSHHHSDMEARQIDRQTISVLEEFKPEVLFAGLNSGKYELCGGSPVVATMLYAQYKGADNVRILKYATSADVSGEKSRVVGYTSALIYRGAKEFKAVKQEDEMLTETQKKRLLEIARHSIENFLTKREKAKFSESDEELIKEKGAFVTIKKGGNLRGCIGHIIADTPLYQTVADMAVEAAFADPRFPALLPEELKEIEIEISALSPLEKIDDVGKIEVGKHGILIRKGFSSGLLLPQVATEYGWNREEFLEHTCNKAGLPKDAWKEGADIYIFSAEVFGE